MGPGLSLREYAKHRKSLGLRGQTSTAVHKAILAGRLVESLSKDGRISDAYRADVEWLANTRGQPVPALCRWWLILGRNLRASGKAAARDAKRSRPTFRERRKAEGGCTKCLLPATDGVHCAKHAEQNRAISAEHQRRRKEERETRLAGAVQARDVGKQLGMGTERVLELAREGLIPFETQGRKGGRLWFRMDAVAAALSKLDIINGTVYRPGSKRGRSVRIRTDERDGGIHTCTECHARLPECDFPPSAMRRGLFVCRRCRRDLHALEREQLSDAYVKDQLSRKTGLVADDMPPILVDAHRAHLRLVRMIRDKEAQ